MRIWIFNHYADTPDRQLTRTYDLAKPLVDQGHSVTIFASGFSHNSFQEERIQSGQWWREEDWSGVRFVWLKTFPYRKNDWRRMLNMVSYAWRAFRRGLSTREKPDAIVGVSVHPLAALTAWAVARLKGSSFFFELTDLWPEVLVDFGMLSPRSPVTRILRLVEGFLYRRARRIIMIWPRTEAYVAQYGVAAEKVVWIPHVADLSRYDGLSAYDGKIHGKFTVMYLGTFANSTAAHVIVESAQILQARGQGDIRFVLVGGGTERGRLIEQAHKLGLQNVEFVGLVAKRDVGALVEKADAFVVSLKNVPLLRYGISLNKLCDYFASGRPTILAGNPAYNPVEVAGAGISVPAEDPEALARAVEELTAMSPEARVQMGRNARNYVSEVHDAGKLARRLEEVLLPPPAKGDTLGAPRHGIEERETPIT